MDLTSLIKKNLSRMTASQLKIAQGLLDDPMLCLFSSIDKFSKDLGVSTATIVRFAKLLGFKGYAALQESQRNQYKSRYEPISRLKAGAIELDKEKDIYNSIFLQQTRLLQPLYTPELERKLEQAIRMIGSANQIRTVGARGSFACAYYLGHHINRILGNCDILEDDIRLGDRILQLKEEDLLIVVNLPRYSRKLHAAVASAKNAGVGIVAISDSFMSPYFGLADVFFSVPIQSMDFHNSMLAAIAVSEIMISVLVTKNKSRLIDNLNKLEQIFEKMDVFV